MTVFYDPQSRKPQPWVIILYVVLPILVILASYTYGQQRHRARLEQEKRNPPQDVFEKF